MRRRLRANSRSNRLADPETERLDVPGLEDHFHSVDDDDGIQAVWTALAGSRDRVRSIDLFIRARSDVLVADETRKNVKTELRVHNGIEMTST
jgi:hypothetical protein